MKISDQLYNRYAAKSPILPPSDDEEVEISIPGLGGLPVIKELSPEEMQRWDDFIQEKKLQKDLDITKEVVDLGGEDKLEEELGTIPAIPGKKKANLSPDGLLRLCSKYYDLALNY